MSESARDATSPRVISMALAPFPPPRLLLCLGSGRRLPYSWTIYTQCHGSHFVMRLHYRIVNVVEEFMAEAGAAKGRDTYAWRFESGQGPLVTTTGMLCG
jgi:hypothetical protein